MNEKDNLTILVPDVIEHTSSPVDFLRKISENYGYGNNKIVISVPNAYSLGSIKDVIVRNKECINMDHKYTFTPTTLLKVMCMAGIIPDNIYFVGQYKLAKIIKSPLLGVTLLATGHFLQ